MLSIFAAILYLVLFLLNAAVFFLLIRLLVGIVPAKPLLFLDRIGDAGVEAVTDAVADRTGHWFKKPLSRRQEYAWALFLVSLIAWALSFFLKALKSL